MKTYSVHTLQLLIPVLLLAGIAFLPAAGQTRPVPNDQLASKELNERVDTLLKKMTLEEKIGQLVQYSAGFATGPGASNLRWDDLVAKGYVAAKPASAEDAAKVDVRETAQLAEYEIPVFFNKPVHQPHLENFFNATRGTAKLNCPADEAFTSEYVIHKANDAVAAQTRLVITPEEVKA